MRSYAASAAALLLAACSSSPAAFASALSGEGRSPNPVVKAAANGMSLIRPAFVAEAGLQAKVLGGKYDETELAQEIVAETTTGKSRIIAYTYGLSPFSSEAIAMLEASGYDYEAIELGKEWFLLGGRESVKRVALSSFVDDGSTSLPKVFVDGKCIGGCSELADAVESGSLVEMMARDESPASSAADAVKGLFSSFLQ